MAALSINVSNVRTSASGQFTTGQITSDTNAGQPLFLNTTLTTWSLANALLTNAPQGIAACSGKAGQNIAIVTKDPNFACGFPINSGNAAIVGNVAGQVNPFEDRVAPWYIHSLGIGIGGNNINFQGFVGTNVAFT